MREDDVIDDRAVRRARAVVTRYCVRNDLRRLWTLTCADQTQDVTVMLRRIRRFIRRLHREYGQMPYVVVLEHHASGALHAHLALPSRFLAHGRVQMLWGHGYVHYRDRQRRRYGGRRLEARSCAKYLGKYLGKDPVRLDRGHRYEVAEGFQPKAVRRSVGSLAAGVELVHEQFAVLGGERLELVWDSSLRSDWCGPPVRYLRYEEVA